MQLPPLCLGKVLPLSAPLLSSPDGLAALQRTVCPLGCFWFYFFLTVIHAYTVSCLQLSVAACLSFDATGLVAVKAQQCWLCHSLTACSRAPGPGFSSSAHAAISRFAPMYPERAFSPAARRAEEAGVTPGGASLPAAAHCDIELVRVSRMAAGKACPGAAAPAQFIILKEVVHLPSPPSVAVGSQNSPWVSFAT